MSIFPKTGLMLNCYLTFRTFQWLWKAVGENLSNYTGFPRVRNNIFNVFIKLKINILFVF